MSGGYDHEPRSTAKKTGPTESPPGAPAPVECKHPARDGLVCVACGNALSMEERLLIVSEMRLKGISRRIVTYELSRRWKITHRQIRTYMSKVDKEWAKEGKSISRLRERGRIVDRLEALYQEADEVTTKSKDGHVANGARRIKLQALQEIAKIAGAYEKERIDLTTNGHAIGGEVLSPADAAKRELAHALARALKDRAREKKG